MSKNQVVPLIIPFTSEINTVTDSNNQTYANEIDQSILPASYLPSPPKYDSNSTYASKYNRAVYFFNFVSPSRHKKRMFGSSLYLVHHYLVIVFFCLSLITIILSLWIQLLMIVPIIFGGIYIIISIYNLIILILNGNLLDDPHLIKDSHFDRFGEQTVLSDIKFEDEWVRLQRDQTVFENKIRTAY